nr:polynucleotide adenylyltransferase family protein [Tanacetum cinerariifolium]
FARKSGQTIADFEPETLDPSTFISVNEVATKVIDLAKKVVDSIIMLVDTDGLHQTMLNYPGFPCSGLVFIPKNSANSAAELFKVLIHIGKSYDEATELKIEDIEVVYKQHVEVHDASSRLEMEDHTIEKPEETSMSQSPMQDLIHTVETITGNEKLPSQLEAKVSKESRDVDADMQVDQSTTKNQSVNKEPKRKRLLTLSSLFK